MEQELFTYLSSDNGFVVQLGIFITLILGGVGFPVPEDIPILIAGVISARGLLSLQVMFLTCYIGVLIADQFVYWIGFFFGKKVLELGTKSKYFKLMTAERVEEVRNGLREKRLLYIFIGRHLFPIRSATFLTAGSLRIPYLEFLVADMLEDLFFTILGRQSPYRGDPTESRPSNSPIIST